MASLEDISRLSKAEKSLASVHSFNYKLGEMLKKEVQCLNREEKNSACSITIDQRIITTRFRNKLLRSAELIKYHDKIRPRLHHTTMHQNSREVKNLQRTGQTSLQRIGEEKQIIGPACDSDWEFSMKRFTDLSASKNRPRTAVDVKSKLWTKRAESAKERVVRAKSAPLPSWCKYEDIMTKLNCGGGGFLSTKNKKQPLSRAKFYEVFDLESFKQFRETELKMQTRSVKSFIQSIEVLKLVPWYPGHEGKIDEKRVIIEERVQRPKFSGFITRTDSFD